MKSNLVLVGFMGAGKSVIGKTLAKMLEMDIVDTDKMIESKMNMKINEIFEKYGEEYFRNIETEIAKDCLNFSNTIISTGGGIVLKEENINYLKQNSVVFLLNASAETIYDRVKNKTDRPLLKVENPLEKIKEMLEFRKKYYEGSADHIITTDNKSIMEVSSEIKKIYITN
ncbi:MAG: shikimate kinase [Fusobacteria bacterium]|nr:shikimate kinase [Fusobacteriota bacterium]